LCNLAAARVQQVVSGMLRPSAPAIEVSHSPIAMKLDRGGRNVAESGEGVAISRVILPVVVER